MRHTFFIVISLAVLLACLIGCTGTDTATTTSANTSKEYLPNLRLNYSDKTFGIVNGTLTPSGELKVTNVGDKTITALNIFMEYNAGKAYHDSNVIEKTISIPPNQSEVIPLSLPSKTFNNSTSLIGTKSKYKVEIVGVQTL